MGSEKELGDAMEMMAPWIPLGLRQAIVQRLDEGAPAQEVALRRRLVTDERLCQAYRRLDPLMPDSWAWLQFLDTCEHAACFAELAPKVRRARATAGKQFWNIETAATKLSELLEATQATVLAAALSPPLELFMVPELVEAAAIGDFEYEVSDAGEHIRALMQRCSERAVPTPARLLRAMACAARDARHGLAEVNPMLGAAAASRKAMPIKSFARAFDQRTPYVEALKAIRLSHAELAAVACATLYLPPSFGRYTEDVMRERYTEAVRAARRWGGRFKTKRRAAISTGATTGARIQSAATREPIK